LEEVGSAFWNPALGGVHGLPRGELHVRWERDPGGGGCLNHTLQTCRLDVQQCLHVDFTTVQIGSRRRQSIYIGPQGQANFIS
ncbi:hypothetical protein DFJ58DRAFT_659310, partial [Suillus subalutaceus]|uniref:uncharacterized protein n=1 Tax=Suillus subalutaceus TaxID=48586 RepID=UPI001B879873